MSHCIENLPDIGTSKGHFVVSSWKKCECRGTHT